LKNLLNLETGVLARVKSKAALMCNKKTLAHSTKYYIFTEKDDFLDSTKQDLMISNWIFLSILANGE
jgi:hypothetical protein